MKKKQKILATSSPLLGSIEPKPEREKREACFVRIKHSNKSFMEDRAKEANMPLSEYMDVVIDRLRGV